MSRVDSEVRIYEVEGKDTSVLDAPTVIVSSHWNESNKVVIRFKGQNITVVAKDLQAAIENAINTSRYGG